MQEYFDILSCDGTPTGEIVSREQAHANGIYHRTVHIWLYKNGKLLLQKRSPYKDSFPNEYDISSAGHVPAGENVTDAALRELNEELGINASREDLIMTGNVERCFKGSFHGKPFNDHELAAVYLYSADFAIDSLVLQDSELCGVKFFTFEECIKMSESDKSPLNCDEIELIRKFINQKD